MKARGEKFYYTQFIETLYDRYAEILTRKEYEQLALLAGLYIRCGFNLAPKQR